MSRLGPDFWESQPTGLCHYSFSSATAAFLKFLSGTAWTGVIPPDFRAGIDDCLNSGVTSTPRFQTLLGPSLSTSKRWFGCFSTGILHILLACLASSGS